MKSSRALARPRFLGIVWPFIAVALFQALLGCFSLYLMSAVRSYVGGESLWSKGQKDAIHSLDQYVLSRDESDWLRYREAMAIPEGDRLLREAMDRPEPDTAMARAGILQGGNHPRDADGIIWLYRYFRTVAPMQEAIGWWTLGDAYLIELDALAQDLHARMAQGEPGAGEVIAWRRRIDTLNTHTTAAAMAFSNALGAGSRQLLALLVGVNLITALSLIVLALWRTHKLLALRRAVADALRLEKERAQITLAAIGDGVISTDVHGAIVYMNPAAEKLTHWQGTQAGGMPLVALFHLLDESEHHDNSMLIEHICRGQYKSGSVHCRLIQRLDGSTVPVALTGSPIHTDGQVSGMVLVLRDLTQERQYVANLSWQAAHDPLTGLVNRSEFEYRLEQLLAHQGASHALLLLDLDQFKLINDGHGHAAGDQLLRHLCTVLPQGLREGDILARLGSDEFGILLHECSPQTAGEIAEGLRSMVEKLHFVWKGRAFMTTASIGMVLIDSLHQSLEDALRAADLACYMAKEKGRNRVQVYRPDDLELSLRSGEMAWIQRLHMALEEDRFCLYAQEIAPLEPEGEGLHRRHVEILLRLRDESGGMVMPDRFIPAAERFGLMSTLDRWVVRRVLGLIAQSLERQPDGAQPALCSINLSGSSIGDSAFLEYLKAQFRSHGVAPGMICFEITETAAIADLGRAIVFINELKALGCLFSLDDFCAGMSSFAYLKHLPVDFLKIDGSFVKDMLDNTVNRSMVEVINHIGHVMGKRTIAEYVETPLIEQVLREMGVDFAQGYLIGRPELLTGDSLYKQPVRLGAQTVH
ncbi:EAL domain-containing protein [Pseudomonas syringae]|nr:EAL domain-containing protein [Pseudomonas syringae]MBD8789185.1 EAL domain-containing protein [Pseudomonas syringae]MBD8800371.1 EAL domain-containing protein [Pseudomonas syringae]MBD8810613.1 EAL domain-containing protein [Pseudomonas syringae]